MSCLAASLYRYVSIYPVSLPFPCSKKKLFIARLPSSRCASRGKTAVEQAKAADQQELDAEVLAPLLRRYEEILTEGYQANPPAPPPEKRTRGRPKQSPARNLLDRLSQGKWAVLRFLLDFAVPFDNNLAERDLRMIKVQQKVSGCFRTEEGVAMFCRLRSSLSTLRKQGIELLSVLEHTLSGHPVLPAFS